MRISEIVAQRQFYHGSQRRFRIGFVLRPQQTGYDHQPETQQVGDLVERYRPQSKLSRRNSVYLVTNPDLIEYAGGYADYVYEVEPLGPVEESDLAWYTEVQMVLDHYVDTPLTEDPPEAIEAARAYWAGTRFKNAANSLIEYRTPEARIIRVL